MKGQKGSHFDFLLSNKFKSNATFFMSMVAIALFALYPTRSRELCMYAILVSTLADLVLMDYNNLPGIILGKKQFYAGMALFGITHVIYMICFSEIANQYVGIGDTYVIRSVSIVFFFVFVGSFIFTIYATYGKSDNFSSAVMIYVMLITFSMRGIYTCAALYKGQYIISAIGITMFWISDMLILIRETKKDTPLIRKLIWVFYPIGQMLIVFSI